MREAGIRVWVLTGDKIETAINIGFSSGLLDTNMLQIHVTASEEFEIKQQLAVGIAEMEKISQQTIDPKKSSLIVSGDSLTVIFSDDNL